MASVFVIGFGNPLRGDDAIGWLAAERLAETNARKDVWVAVRHQLTPELSEPASRADLVIFVDASEGGTPGELVCARVSANHSSRASFTHDLDPAAVLACARELYGRSPEGYVITVAGESFGYEERLSLTVEAAFPLLLDRIEELIRTHI